jgi:hypothetical protein
MSVQNRSGVSDTKDTTSAVSQTQLYKCRDICRVGSSDFDKIFENCFASCSFGMAKDI